MLLTSFRFLVLSDVIIFLASISFYFDNWGVSKRVVMIFLIFLGQWVRSIGTNLLEVVAMVQKIYSFNSVVLSFPEPLPSIGVFTLTINLLSYLKSLRQGS